MGRKVDFTWKISPGIVNGVDVKAGDTVSLPEDQAKRYYALGYGNVGTKAIGRPYERDEALADEIAREIAAQVPAESRPVNLPIVGRRPGF